MRESWVKQGAIFGAVLCMALVFSFYAVNTFAPTPNVELLSSHQIPQSFIEAAKRDGHWPSLRKAHLVREPYCQYCGGTEKLQVHHIRPFHLHPELELDPNNLITLCEAPGKDCHLRFGHEGNFRTGYDVNIVELCRKHRQMLKDTGQWPKEIR